MTLKGLKLRGRTLDIAVDGDRYEVRDGSNRLDSAIGRPIVVRGGRLEAASEQ